MRTRLSLSFPYLVLATGAALAQSPTGVDPSRPPSELVGPSYLLADFDGDRLEDVYLVDPAGGDRLFRNLGDGAFEDVTAQHGLAGITGSRTAVWLDFDRDGALDLYVSHAQGKSRLFQNTIGGYFVDVSAGAGLAHTGAELFAQALDYDGDLLLDLHLVTEQGDLLFHNLGGGTFEPATGLEESASGLVAEPIASPARGAGTAQALDPTEGGDAGPGGTPSRGSREPWSSTGRALGERSLVPEVADGAPPTPLGVSPFVIGHTCTQKIVDQANGNCSIQASTTPTLGTLYPLSTSFNVNPSGNVGIGTTGQTAKLDVVGGMHIDYGGANTGSTANALGFGNSSSLEAIASKRNPGGNQFGLDFYTLGLNRLTITNSGLVGVNTTTPEGKMHVVSSSAGAVTANTSSSLVLERSPENYLSILSPDASERGILFGEPSNNVAGGIMYNNAATLDGLQFRTNGNTTRMAVTGGGNVGVGTTAPTNHLHVSSTQQTPFRVESNHTGGTWLELDNTSTNADKWHLISTGSTNGEGPGKLLVRDATTGVLSTTFDSNGNVGIGTGFPSERLTVAGGISVDNGNANSGSVANALVFGGVATLEGIGSKRTAGGNQFGLDFYTQGINRIRVTNGGLVGIGRTPTTNALEVQGDACKTSGGATWLVCSDRRIKTEIETIENALDTIGALRLVEYRYTSAYLDANPGVEDKVYYNVIAQEYQDVFPDYVQARADDGILQVDTHPALMHAIAAIQELEEVVEGKDQRIAALEDRLTRMEEALAMLSAK